MRLHLQLSTPYESSEDGMTRVSGSRMRTLDPHLLEEKIDEAVTHYINSHPSEAVHIDAHTLSLNVHDNAINRVVTVMHSQNFPSQMCRQVSVGDQVGDGPWTEELLDPEGRLAALVAQIAQNSRSSHHGLPHHKVPLSRSDVDSAVLLESPLRLYNGHSLEPQPDSLVVEVPNIPPLPPLTHMKRCQETDWFNKAKTGLKDSGLDDPSLELTPGSSPATRQQSRKSLPHKKRISRKLKRSHHQDPAEDIVVINCNEEVQQEEILPDNYVTSVQHTQHLTEETHHIAHEMRAILICQLCGEFYGEEQLKFYQHLKQHYEPSNTIIIENPAPPLPSLPALPDKMSNACIVDNVATLPDSIVELSLENTLPKTTIYQPIDKQILYSSNEKTLYTATKSHYSMANMAKDDLYESVGKVEVYSCTRCNKSFRKQKHCEAHIKEQHSKLQEEMNEFSEPEDLMEGIHVAVDEELEHALPHLTVDNGTVRQDHVRHWYLCRDSSCGEATCNICAPRPAPPHDQLKEEIIQKIFEVDAHHDPPAFAHSLMPEPPEHSAHPDHPDHLDHPEHLEHPEHPEPPAVPHLPPGPAKGEEPEAETQHLTPKPEQPQDESKKSSKRIKKFVCTHCGRVFNHRNSLIYHALSHGESRPHACPLCPKSFYTRGALKIHGRVHNGDRPYSCSECGRRFRQWGDLRYHISSLHSDQKNFKCDFCGKEFARKYSLNVHRKIHTGEKDYACAHCPKTFRTASYRNTHMRTHTGYKPHKCPTCDKNFRMAGDLRRHMLIHEKAKNKIEVDKKPKILKSPIKEKEEQVEQIKKEPEEQKIQEKKIKKIATASTTRLPVLKTVEKKKPDKKKHKKGAPNVVVAHPKDDAVFKGDYNEIYGKMKEIYSDQNIVVEAYCKQDEYGKPKDRFEDREFATLRPMFRNPPTENGEPSKDPKENTDGKLTVFTQLEKSRILGPHSHIISDIRQNLELRDGGEVQGEALENAFIERLTALYNIPV